MSNKKKHIFALALLLLIPQAHAEEEGQNKKTPPSFEGIVIQKEPLLEVKSLNGEIRAFGLEDKKKMLGR